MIVWAKLRKGRLYHAWMVSAEARGLRWIGLCGARARQGMRSLNEGEGARCLRCIAEVGKLGRPSKWK